MDITISKTLYKRYFIGKHLILKGLYVRLGYIVLSIWI
jgi:hypothetical protein